MSHRDQTLINFYLFLITKKYENIRFQVPIYISRQVPGMLLGCTCLTALVVLNTTLALIPSFPSPLDSTTKQRPWLYATSPTFRANLCPISSSTSDSFDAPPDALFQARLPKAPTTQRNYNFINKFISEKIHHIMN